uniref:KIAA2026 n=3 Tax=Otolemur garnettii TaxID=30611 RepID=H0XM61_OTOGA
PTVVAESLKQTLPPSLNKTYIKTPEQPQIVLIPSTVGAPIKINSSPTVSQIKDVKIGLNIGQAIVNTSGTVPAIPSINILQNVIPKGEDKSSKGYILPLSTSCNSIPVSSNFVSQNITPVNESVVSATRAVNMFSVTGASVSLGSFSVTSASASAGTRPPVLVSGNDTSSRIMPILSNRLCTSNLGNTVAISTVKTGHLASSVLISATQPTVSPKCLTSALQIPVTVALPTPVTASPKIMNTVQHSAAVPEATCSLPKRQSWTSLQFHSPGISTTVPTNVNTAKPQTELSSLSPSPGKITNISNLASLPNQQMPPSLVKSTPSYSSVPGGSSIHTATAPSNVTTSLVGSQFNEPCIQQKIVINTSTPLAPGTQIMINGTRFIVPPQGLGAGSHVLLISTSPKYGPPLILNSSQGIQPTPVDNPAHKITLASNNSLRVQPIKHSLKSSTKIVNSFGNTSSLPTVNTTPQIINTTAKVSVPSPAPPVSLTSVIKSPPATILAKTPSLASAICSSNPPLPSNTSVFHLDTSVKKLLVSPEGAILNTINTPASKVSSLSSSLSQIVVSASRNPVSVFPDFQSSGLEKPDTAAS